MAKTKVQKENVSKKINFGTKKTGKAKKTYNKHNPKPKEYRGQGR